MERYETLVQALNDLKARGFTSDFNLAGDCIECTQLDLRLHPDQFEIVEVHRFEGMTNPDDSTVLYAIMSPDGVRGTFVMAYGSYADGVHADFIRKLQIHPGTGQN